MKPVVLLACVLFVIAVIRIIRLPLRRDINLLQAAGCACLGFGSALVVPSLLYVAGAFFVLSIYRSMTFKKRMLNDLAERAGLSSEDADRVQRSFQQLGEADDRREAEEQEQRAAADAFEAAYRVDPDPGAITVTTDLAKAVTFPVAEGGELVLEPGPCQLEIEMALELTEGEDTPLIRMRTRINDGDGNTWETVTFCDPDILLLGVMEADAPITGNDLVPWSEISDDWRSTIREHCLLSGIDVLLDSRDYYEIRIGGEEFTIQEKYQGPILDLAWQGETGKFLVRVRGLYHVTEDDIGDVPPFLFERSPDFVAPFAPHCHWAVAREWLEVDEDEKTPIRFRKADSAAELLPSARFSGDK